jgi:serine/threonine protein kinase
VSYDGYNLASFFLGAAGLGGMQEVFLGNLDGDVNFEDARVSMDDFTLAGKLGKGGFGSVYRAIKKDSNEVFAMKFLDKSVYRRKRVVDKAYEEKNILRVARHPCLVQLHYAFQFPENWVLVMDFCTGGDLNSLLIRDGNPGLSQYVCAQLSGEVLLGLEYLHSKSIIHRDIKPKNIVRTADGHARITDFGLAKAMEQGVPLWQVCGSYGYLPPEMGNSYVREYTTKADLFPTGVTLYVLLTGGETGFDESGEMLKVPPKDLALRVPRGCYGTEAQDLLEKLMEPRPSRRFSATQAKEHQWYALRLGHSVDELISST